MVASGDDIILTLTGGPANTDPDQSLGGEPSNYPITGVINNLFDNLNSSQSTNGHTDYRCIYVFNNNSIDSLYEVKAYIQSETDDGSEIELGITNKLEIQKITLVGTPTDGSFEISYTPPGESLQTRTVFWNIDLGIWTDDIQSAINSITTLNCIVTAAGSFSNRVFNLSFTDYRSHDIIGLDISNLTGVSNGSITKTIEGSPVNAVPPELDFATTPPADVVFSKPVSYDAFELGTIYPEEGFPLWIKRTTAEDTEAIASDGFKLRISANALP